MMAHSENRVTETVYALSISCLGPSLIFQQILIMCLQLILAKRMLIVVVVALWQGFNELNEVQEQLSPFTEMVEAEATDQHHKLLLPAVIHDYETLAKTGSECCLDRERLIVKPPGHSELTEFSEYDKII